MFTFLKKLIVSLSLTLPVLGAPTPVTLCDMFEKLETYADVEVDLSATLSCGPHGCFLGDYPTCPQPWIEAPKSWSRDLAVNPWPVAGDPQGRVDMVQAMLLAISESRDFCECEIKTKVVLRGRLLLQYEPGRPGTTPASWHPNLRRLKGHGHMLRSPGRFQISSIRMMTTEIKAVEAAKPPVQ